MIEKLQGQSLTLIVIDLRNPSIFKTQVIYGNISVSRIVNNQFVNETLEGWK